MRLHITLIGDSARGPWSAAYIGDRASEARKALDASPKPWALLIDNPPLVRKRTPAAQADPVEAAPVVEVVPEAAEAADAHADPVEADFKPRGRRR